MGIFSYDSPITKALSTIVDYIILNLCFLVCCIPVFTIGAALSALSSVSLKEQDSTNLFSSYFRAFKENFKQSTKAWIVFLLVGIILVIEIYFFFFSGLAFPAEGIIRIILCFSAFVYLGAIIFTFPLIAKFDNSIPGTLANACIFSVILAPVTLLMILLSFLPVVCLLLCPDIFVYIFALWIFIGFSMTSRIHCLLINKLLSKLLPSKT